MNRVLLTGHLTRDPEMRELASGKSVTMFTVATTDYVDGAERSEYHAIVAWDRLAEIAGRYLGKRQLVAVEGRLQTRSWDDESGRRHWKTEVVADRVEMLSGRGKGALRETADPAGADANPDAGSEPDPGSDAHANSDADTDAHADADTDASRAPGRSPERCS